MEGSLAYWICLSCCNVLTPPTCGPIPLFTFPHPPQTPMPHIPSPPGSLPSRPMLASVAFCSAQRRPLVEVCVYELRRRPCMQTVWVAVHLPPLPPPQDHAFPMTCLRNHHCRPNSLSMHGCCIFQGGGMQCNPTVLLLIHSRPLTSLCITGMQPNSHRPLLLLTKNLLPKRIFCFIHCGEVTRQPSIELFCVAGCRGRARAHGSHYVLMLEKGNRDHQLLLSQVVG